MVNWGRLSILKHSTCPCVSHKGSRQRRCDKASTGRFTLLEGNGNTESN